MGSESGGDQGRLDPCAVVDNANKRRVQSRAGENRTDGAEEAFDPAVLVRSKGLSLRYIGSIFAVEEWVPTD